MSILDTLTERRVTRLVTTSIDKPYKYDNGITKGWAVKVHLMTEDGTGPYVFSTTLNALGATNTGLELIARQRLLFLPAPLNGLGVSLSATLTRSDGRYPGRLDEKLPTYGFSDRIYNAALEYNAGRFRARKTGTGAWVLYRLS